MYVNWYTLQRTNTENSKQILELQSQFPHSCVCERFLYTHDRFAYSAAGNMWSHLGNI
jgi:hypothetical protein